MSIEAYTAYRRASRRRSSRTPFNPLKSIENEIEITDDFENSDNTDLEDVGIKIKTEPFADFYTVECELGRGKFATVKKCRCNTTGQVFAAKIQRKRRKAKDARNELIHEIKMLAMCKIHPKIIGLKEVFETRHEMIIVTDFASGGELYKYIEDTEYGFPEELVKRLLQQTLEGLTFLHARNIVHMDIKPQNILMMEESVNSEVVLCDLGFSRTVNSGEDVREIVGTPDFVAPEVLSYEPINTSCDMWSVGVLTYMMLSNCSPFAGNDKMETFSNITQANVDFPDELFENVSNEAKDFIRKLLIKNPSKRMTSPECLEHAWLEEAESKSSSSDSEDDANEEKYKKDLSTIKENDSEEDSSDEFYSAEENEEEQKKDLIVTNDISDNITVTNEISDDNNKTVSNEISENETVDNEVLDNRSKCTVKLSLDCTKEAESVSILTNEDKDNKTAEFSMSLSPVADGLEHLASIMEEEYIEENNENNNDSINTENNSDNNNNNEDNKLTVETLKESPSQSKALKELTNQRTALATPSPLSSPIGCRRTLVPSPDTVLENEPFKKHHCRRDSNEVKQILKSNIFKVEKSKILELDCDENTDTSAIVSKRGSQAIMIRKTPIKTVRHTKSLVTFYENLQHS